MNVESAFPPWNKPCLAMVYDLCVCVCVCVRAHSVTQLHLTLCTPVDCGLPGYSVRGILQARTLEWVAISFSNAWKWSVKGKSLSHVWLLATPWTAAYQAPLSMGSSRQEYWSGVPLPSLECKDKKYQILLATGFSFVVKYWGSGLWTRWCWASNFFGDWWKLQKYLGVLIFTHIIIYFASWKFLGLFQFGDDMTTYTTDEWVLSLFSRDKT